MSRSKHPSNYPKNYSLAAILSAFIIGGIGGYGVATYWQPQEKRQQIQAQVDHANIQVRFSPDGACNRLIIQAIQAAKASILVQAYYFTSAPIADALVDAHTKGVAVKMLVDRSQLTVKCSKIAQALAAGIPVAVDQVPGIAHNKVMIIDDETVITGSFNWTDAAEKRNAENILLIQDKHINQIYRTNWEQRAIEAESIHLTQLHSASSSQAPAKKRLRHAHH